MDISGGKLSAKPSRMLGPKKNAKMFPREEIYYTYNNSDKQTHKHTDSHSNIQANKYTYR